MKPAFTEVFQAVGFPTYKSRNSLAVEVLDADGTTWQKVIDRDGNADWSYPSGYERIPVNYTGDP